MDENITVTDHYSSANRYQTGLGDAQWHTMGFLWEEDHWRAYYDGELVIDQKYGKGKFTDPKHSNVKGQILVEDVFSYLNEQQCPIIISGSKGNPMEIDYIRVWQTGGEDLSAQPKNKGALIGVIVGACVLVIALAVVGVLVYRKRNNRVPEKPPQEGGFLYGNGVIVQKDGAIGH